MSRNLADMRRDYTRDGLSEELAPDEPFALFHQWFAEAVKTEQAPVAPSVLPTRSGTYPLPLSPTAWDLMC